MKGDIFLTQEGYEKLKAELDHLKNVKRKEIAKALEYARSLGDLSENAEYTAAQEAYASNEKKIAELEEKLTRVRIIDNENISDDKVYIGAKVLLKDLASDEELEYTLVSPEEADFSEGKISVTSPVGKALLGHKAEEIVEIKVPAGMLKYKILKISR
ncbi:MAG: transcription elongation factor GreA [Candidatus Omnitrophica bacterium 4484_70.1]|nr:MAG: transcription elongation factor GreA [Candidatus Omnitrophica bacterium 4484_70.1]